MHTRRMVLVSLIIIITLSACQAAITPIPPSTAPNIDSSTRNLLTYTDLINGFDAKGIIHENAIKKPDDSTLSPHIFEGRLELLGEINFGDAEVLAGSLPEKYLHLPEFNYTFIQVNDYLVPLERGLIITEQDTYDIILEPGRIWQESTDQGYSRASLPFSLVFKGANGLFSGTLTFLFDGISVSKVWYQITQEITTTIKANMWGLLDASYHPEILPDPNQVRDAFNNELASHFPTVPITQLADKYPAIDLSAFGSGVTPAHMGWYGVIVDGVNYLGGCQTRAGVYPYCEWMRQPSYSVAKSTFPALALMRLAQSYNPGVTDLLIKNFVPEAADSNGNWDVVTINHALDMATGNYESNGFMVDDNSEKMGEFFSSSTFEERIASAFNSENMAEPGTTWVYRTSDTFIATRALQNFLQSQTGADDDIFDYVVNEIYRPLNLNPGTLTTKRTSDDNWHGQAEGGYGLWFIPDDIAKLTTFLLLQNGKIGKEQILNPDILAASLQQTETDRGMQIGPDYMYNNAFWAQKFGPAQGYDCEFWVSEWQGVSGNVVALFPNGIIYYYFSDNQEFIISPAVNAADQIQSFCQ